MFRDEIVECMKQLTELKLSDLLPDEEFVSRMEDLLSQFREARGLATAGEDCPTDPEVPPLFAVKVEGPEGQLRLEFYKGEVTIGRSSESDIVLPRTDISRRHARLVIRDQRFVLMDLKSENGTYVNGHLLASPQVVHSTDQITIGDYKLCLEPYW